MRSWSRPAVPQLAGGGPQIRLGHAPHGVVGPVAATGAERRLYVCGITPYDATHLGHAATYLAFDLLYRSWLDAGLSVSYTQNVTDVDDPLLERASATGQDWRALADREIELFRRDMTALRILPPTHYLGVVEAIDEVAAMVVALLAAGAAYRLEGDVYFSVAAAPHLGAVSGLDRAAMLELAAQRGGDPKRAGKLDPLDPLLWRAARPGEPSWPSELGAGRPGWHVECAAIALRWLGAQIHVEGGGSDLMFPHHELGAAHVEVLTGRHPFAAAYVHSGMVGYQGEKMSKSLGNLVLVSRLLDDGADPTALRAALLAHHYRSDWDWQPAELPAATARVRRWRSAVAHGGPDAGELLERVRAALADDLHADRALLALDDWASTAHAGSPATATASSAVRVADALLGLDLTSS